MAHRSNPARAVAQSASPWAAGDVAALLARWDPRSDDDRTSDLIESIENDEPGMRFVPDIPGASYKTAA